MPGPADAENRRKAVADPDAILGQAVAAVGTTARRALRARAVRACALAAEAKARRVPGRLRRTFGAIGR